MYSFQNLSAPLGDLYTNINLTLLPGRVVCLTGPNGSGKTMLLQQLRELALLRGDAVLYLSQAPSVGGEASPGQIRREILERLLREVSRDTILLLDEPTNHLDRDSLRWFLEELYRHRAAILTVTHDRRLLHIAHRIYHLEDGILVEYGGNLDLYEDVRRREREARERDMERARIEVREAERELRTTLAKQEKRRHNAERHGRTQRHPKAMVNFQRNRADRTAARLENSHSRRVRALQEKKEEAKNSIPGEGRPFHPVLPANSVFSVHSRRGGSLDLVGVVLRQGESGLLRRGLSFRIAAGGRIGVRGAIGSGKSTLLRLMAGMEEPLAGRIFRSTEKAVLLDQSLTLLDHEESPLRFLERMTGTDGAGLRGELRTLLANIGFSGERVFQKCGTLSGGERMRLALGGALKSGADLLLLDEPTNDLDLRARDELIEILRQVRSTIVVVSHDDAFLESLLLDDILDLDVGRYSSLSSDDF